MRKLLISIGILLIVGAVGWKLVITPKSNLRFPPNWHYNVNSLGRTSYPDQNGQFPAGTTLKDAPVDLLLRDVTISKTNPDGTVELSDHYRTLDPATKATTWDYTYKAVVDPVTGKHAEPGLTNDYFFFPRNAQKTTYHVRNTSYQGIPVSFQGEENVSGINTYHYHYEGDLDNTAAYPDTKLGPDQTITCFGFQLDYWVEPVTGEIVKFREWCEGDWVVNTKTGEHLYALSRWGNVNTGDDLIRRVAEVKSMVNNSNWNNLYIPLLLGGLGVVVLAFGVGPMIIKRRTVPVADKTEEQTV